LCESPATVGEPTGRRAFVFYTGVARFAAIAVDADLAIAATSAAATATVDPRGTNALVLNACESITQAVTAEDRFLLTATSGRNGAALGAALIASAAVLLAAAGEILAICTADGAGWAAATFDGPIATIWKSSTFDGNAEGCEFGDHLVAGLGNTFWFLGVVTAAIRAPAEIARRTVRRLTTAEQTVGDREVTPRHRDHCEDQRKTKAHQNLPFTEIPVGPMLTSGSASS